MAVKKKEVKDPKIVINIVNNKEGTKGKKVKPKKKRAKKKPVQKTLGIIHQNDKYNPIANTMYMGNSGIPTYSNPSLLQQSNKPEYSIVPYNKVTSPPTQEPKIITPVTTKPLLQIKAPIKRAGKRFKTGNEEFDNMTLKQCKIKAEELGIYKKSLNTKSKYKIAFQKYLYEKYSNSQTVNAEDAEDTNDAMHHENGLMHAEEPTTESADITKMIKVKKANILNI